MGMPTIEGESPVSEILKVPVCQIPKYYGGTEKLRRNLGGPPPKAKYKVLTDSVRVPRGKGEKNPGRGVK